MIPESLAQDHALRLIHFRLEPVSSDVELFDRLAGNQRISTETRATTLEVAKGSRGDTDSRTGCSIGSQSRLIPAIPPCERLPLGDRKRSLGAE
jgi:hypothetical protein